MTREEAIERLKDGAPFSELLDVKWEEAINMAIEALKAQPCEITRCKNCDEWSEHDVCLIGGAKYCCVHHCYTGEDYFCGDGVKRGE